MLDVASEGHIEDELRMVKLAFTAERCDEHLNQVARLAHQSELRRNELTR